MMEADYLVIGSGATGMAFVDTLLAETDASVVMVDRYHQPGGHWNHAYPFVRLHQASSYYGVNSRQLGGGGICQSGWNRGLFELASSNEVCAYLDQVMQQQLLPTGRIRYFPKCEYDSNGQFHSLLSHEQYKVSASKIVDATFIASEVPSTNPPAYEVREGVNCVPPNGLVDATGEYSNYTVIGSGKTGIDACLFLLQHGVNPDAICWIMPRDAWYYNPRPHTGRRAVRTIFGPFYNKPDKEYCQRRVARGVICLFM